MKIPKCDVGMYDPKGHPLNRMRAKNWKKTAWSDWNLSWESLRSISYAEIFIFSSFRSSLFSISYAEFFVFTAVFGMRFLFSAFGVDIAVFLFSWVHFSYCLCPPLAWTYIFGCSLSSVFHQMIACPYVLFSKSQHWKGGISRFQFWIGAAVAICDVFC